MINHFGMLGIKNQSLGIGFINFSVRCSCSGSYREIDSETEYDYYCNLCTKCGEYHEFEELELENWEDHEDNPHNADYRDLPEDLDNYLDDFDRQNGYGIISCNDDRNEYVPSN